MYFSGEKPYKCDWNNCRKAFLHLENLHLHRQHHTETKPFPCDHCSLAYWQKCSLKSHQVKVHGNVCDDAAPAHPIEESSDAGKSGNSLELEKAPDDGNENDSKSNEKSGSASICSKELNVYEFCESEEEAEMVMPRNSRASSSGGRFKAFLSPKECVVLNPPPSPVSPPIDLSPMSKPSVKKPLRTYLKAKKIKSKEPAAVELEIVREVEELCDAVGRHEEQVMEKEEKKMPVIVEVKEKEKKMPVTVEVKEEKNMPAIVEVKEKEEKKMPATVEVKEKEEKKMPGTVEVENEPENSYDILDVGKKVKKTRGKGKKRKMVEDAKNEEKEAAAVPIKKRKCIAAAAAAVVIEKTEVKVKVSPKTKKGKEKKAKRKNTKACEVKMLVLKNSVIASDCKASGDVAVTKNSANSSESRAKSGVKGMPKKKRANKKSIVLEEEVPVFSLPCKRKKATAQKPRPKKGRPKAQMDEKLKDIPVIVLPYGKGRKRKCAATAAGTATAAVAAAPVLEVAGGKAKEKCRTKLTKAMKSKKPRGKKGKLKERKGVTKVESDSKLAKKRRKNPMEIVYDEPIPEETEGPSFLTEPVQNCCDSPADPLTKVDDHEDKELKTTEPDHEEDKEEELVSKEEADEDEGTHMEQADEEESEGERGDCEETPEKITDEEDLSTKQPFDLNEGASDLNEDASDLNEDAGDLNEDASDLNEEAGDLNEETGDLNEDTDTKSPNDKVNAQEDLSHPESAKFYKEKHRDAETHSEAAEGDEDQELENEDKDEDEDKEAEEEITEEVDKREYEDKKEEEDKEEYKDNDEQNRCCALESPINGICYREIKNLSSHSMPYPGQTEDEENTTDFMDNMPSRYEDNRLASSEEATHFQFSQDVSMGSDYQPEKMSAASETPTADEAAELHSSLAVPVIVTQVQQIHDDLPESPTTPTVGVDNRDGGNRPEELEYSTAVCSNNGYSVPCNSYTDIEAMYRRQSMSPNEHHSTDSQPGTSGSLFANPYSSHYPLLSLRPSEHHHPLQSLEGLASGSGPVSGSVSGSYFNANCKTSIEPVCKSLSGYSGASHASTTPTYVAPPSGYGVEQVSLERSQDYNYIVSGRGASAGSGGVADLKFPNAQHCQDGVPGTPHTLPLSTGLASSNTISKDFFGQYFQDPGHLPIGQDHQRSQGFVGQQSGLSALQRSNSEFFRCNASALLPSTPYSSMPESLLGVKHPRLTQPPAAVAQPQHWPPTHEDRTNRPWDQVSQMIVQSSDNAQRNTYAGSATNRPDYGHDVSGSSSSTQSSAKRMDSSSSFRGMSPSVLAQPDLYGVPNAYSLTYSPTAAGAGYSRTLPASQKHLEEAYRHAAAAHITDYRTLAAAQAHHAPPPLPDVYGAMGINPALSEFDRYYYTARDAMYRSQQLASAMPHPFMQQGSTASQMGAPYVDRATYGREPVYGQPSPYGFMCDKQYLSAAPANGGKMVQGGSMAGDYLHPPVDQQDPYRRSVIYMPRYF